MPRKLVARRNRKASTKKKQKTERTKEYADIPECLDQSYADKEYTTSREEKIWDPEMEVEQWFPHYSLAARIVLTYNRQPEVIPTIEAIENSCSGIAKQYISDVLHESNYEPHKALETIFMKGAPQKITDKWKPEEMKLFTKGIMKYGKNFSIIRRKMLPHKRVEDFAEFYYVWKRSSMAEEWRKRRAIIKAEEKELEERRMKERSSNQSNNIPPSNLSNNRIMTRSATAAAILSLQNNKGTDDGSQSSVSTSPSKKNEGTSSAAESTDSSMEHVQKPENEVTETVTSKNSPMKDEQISNNSVECPKRKRRRKLSIPRKIVNFEEESADEIIEIKYIPASIIPQWKRQRKCEHVVYDLSM